MKKETEQTKVIKQYENLISFCNSLSAVTLANNLHKKKVDFLCEQYSEGTKAVQDANAYLTMMKKILCMSCDNLCSNYYYNYELYHRILNDIKERLFPLRESARVQIDTLIQGFLTNALNPTGLEYIWTRVVGDRDEFYAAVNRMFLNFDLNKKLEFILNDVNTALISQANELTNILTWKKVALDESQEADSKLEQPDLSQFMIEMPQVNEAESSSGKIMDYSQRFVEEILPIPKMRQKMSEYRKAKVIEKIQDDYTKECKRREEELISIISNGLEQVIQVMEQYCMASFFQVNGRTVEEIPAEILRLEQKTTEFKKEEAECRLIPYLTPNGTFQTIVSSYAVRFSGLLEQDVTKMAESFSRCYIAPWKENLGAAVYRDIALYQKQNQESKEAQRRLEEFLHQSYESFTEVNEITSKIEDYLKIENYSKIEFGALKERLDEEVRLTLSQIKIQIQQELQVVTSKKELYQEDQLRIGIKAMNDIPYQKFLQHWSLSLKASVRSMIERKDFSSIPASINYEVYLSEMQPYLGMDAKELESIKEVMEYRHTACIRLPRYQLLKVSVESNNSNDDLIREIVEKEIVSYLQKIDEIQKEMKEIWNNALRLYISEYGEAVLKNQINPVLDRIQFDLLEEYQTYVLEEHMRGNYNYMDFTKYIHVYGKFKPQILEFILGNEKSFPMESIAYDHWADGTAVTTQNFRVIARNVKERWLTIKTKAEGQN